MRDNETAYSVMRDTLDAYSLTDPSFETCKRYCRNGDVIVKMIPYVAGFSIKIMWHKFHRLIEFKKRYRYGNILYIHFYWRSEYLRKIDKVVYRS